MVVMVRKDLVGLGAKASFRRMEIAQGERGKALVILDLGEQVRNDTVLSFSPVTMAKAFLFLCAGKSSTS